MFPQSLQGILERAKAKGITAMEMAERIADGDVPSDLSAPQKKNLVEFVRVIRVMRVQAKNVSRLGYDPGIFY